MADGDVTTQNWARPSLTKSPPEAIIGMFFQNGLTGQAWGDWLRTQTSHGLKSRAQDSGSLRFRVVEAEARCRGSFRESKNTEGFHSNSGSSGPSTPTPLSVPSRLSWACRPSAVQRK